MKKEVAAVRPEEESSEGEVDEEEVRSKGAMGERVRAERNDDMIKSMADPRKPTQKEVEAHEITHLPYRNWCPVCVKAKGKDLDHRRDVRENRGLPEFSFDYCFPGDEAGQKLTIF